MGGEVAAGDVVGDEGEAGVDLVLDGVSGLGLMKRKKKD